MCVAIIIGSFFDTGVHARTHARTRLAGLEEAGQESGRRWERVSSIRGRACSAVRAARELAAEEEAEEDEDDEDAGDESSGGATQTPQSGARALVNAGASSESCPVRADVHFFFLKKKVIFDTQEKKVGKRRCPKGGWSRWDVS